MACIIRRIITYDAAGNPLSYYNGQSYTFTWEDGNQLASATVGGKTISFDYNSDGIRTAKYVAGEADYYYRLNGTKVVEMVMDSDIGYFSYLFMTRMALLTVLTCMKVKLTPLLQSITMYSISKAMLYSSETAATES